jgi:intracellular multiplication protein IcmL
VKYHYQLQSAQKYFTNYGWSNYIKALNASNNVVALKERKMIVIAHVVGKPKILAQGILSGAYAWKFSMPVLISYSLPPYDDKSKFTNPLTVTLIVQRQPILQSYKGLGIVQIIGSMAAGSDQPQELSNTPSG